jgi:predicted DNA-binding transcriptional regulator YafY
MAAIQKAISKRCVLSIVYFSSGKQERTTRLVEPIGVVYYSGRWHLIAWCRLRNGYRDFRIDMIQSLHDNGESFDPRSHFTLQEYFDSLTSKHDDMEKVVIVFDSSVSKYARNARYYYGFVSEEDLGDRCRMTFLAGNLRSFCRWLMMFGKGVQIEHPTELRDIMEELIEELSMHYSSLGMLR